MVSSDGLHQLVQFAFDHAVQLVKRQTHAVVRQAVLRKVVGADLLGALPRLHLAPACVPLRFFAFGALLIEQPATQNLEGLRLVLQ